MNLFSNDWNRDFDRHGAAAPHQYVWQTHPLCDERPTFVKTGTATMSSLIASFKKEDVKLLENDYLIISAQRNEELDKDSENRPSRERAPPALRSQLHR